MDDVVQRVDLEDAENGVVYEPQDPNQRVDDAEYQGEQTAPASCRLL